MRCIDILGDLYYTKLRIVDYLKQVYGILCTWARFFAYHIFLCISQYEYKQMPVMYVLRKSKPMYKPRMLTHNVLMKQFCKFPKWNIFMRF